MPGTITLINNFIMDISKVWFDNNCIFIKTFNGIEKSMPLKWFPRLLNATKIQRENFELSPFGIHWKAIDEDLSFEGFFNFKKEDFTLCD